MTKVSVIMSAYNCESFLAKSLDSLLNQSYSDFELILTDDGSIDQTRKIIESYRKKDKRIVPVYNDMNLGLTINLNRAIAMSKGELIARMDADDIAYPSRFKSQVYFLDNNPNIDLVGSASVEIDQAGDEIRIRSVPETHQEIIDLLPIANPITHSTVMFRKRSFEKIHFYNENYRTTQDYEMWFRAAGTGILFHNLKEILLKYRIDDNYMKRKSFRYRFYDFKLRVNSFKYIDLPYYKYYYALIPIILGLVPKRLYFMLKKMDPRAKYID